MVLILIIFFSNPCFSKHPEKVNQSKFLELKSSIIKLEGQENISIEGMDRAKKLLSDLEEEKSLETKLEEWDDRLSKISDNLSKRKFFGNWNLFLGWVTWAENASGLESQEYGPCLGGGYDLQNYWLGYGIDLCIGSLDSEVGNQTSTADKTDYSMTLIYSRPKIFWRPDEHVRLIFYLPLIYRNGGLADSEFSFGALIGGEWETSGIVIGSSIGKIFGFESSTWNITLGYRF